jgi:hypothetical protein
MQKRWYAAIPLLFVGLVLTTRGYAGAMWLGDKYIFQDQQNSTWLMNPSLPFPAREAYTWFAVDALILGGFFIGLAIALIEFKYARAGIVAIFPGVILSALGFNTFDWMQGAPSLTTVWNFWLNNVVIKGWDFYLLCVLAPLFIGGVLVSGVIFSALCAVIRNHH